MTVENIPLLLGLGIAFLALGFLAIKIVWELVKLAVKLGIVAFVVAFVIIAGFWITKAVHFFT